MSDSAGLVADIDSQGLEKLGYRQELSRQSRGLSHILFMTLAIMAVPYGLSAPIATGLIGGGPATIVWGYAKPSFRVLGSLTYITSSWLLVSVLTQPVALSLAEICSVYPTSAGAYYWTYRLAPPKYRLLLSWINGWLYTVGVWTISLSVTFGTAQLIVAGAGIFHPEWVAKPWQTYLIFVGVTAFASVFVLFLNELLPTVDRSGLYSV
ncbi:hypothetical protein H0H92_011965 [Tricholoma furcatifolium]|nr:hypothetical protein H0H92_011965 [Tricholoma furcatifolium]